MNELTREFLIESQEGLDRMERCLTDLEERPDDAASIADVFRSVHTIKGTTGFLGFKRLEKLAHAGENLLGLLRDGKLAANAPIITGLLQLLDGLRSILKTIEADGNEGEGSDAEIMRIEGADISFGVVGPAQQGTYHRIEINRGLPARHFVRHFDHVGEDWIVRPEIASFATFPRRIFASRRSRFKTDSTSSF